MNTSDARCLTLIRSFLVDASGLAEDRIHPDDRFADLGLDSFAAQQLRLLLATESGVRLPLTSFLGEQTLRSVLDAVSEARGEARPGEGRAPEGPGAPLPVAPPPGIRIPEGPGTESAPLTPVQAAYWVGRGDDFPLGGVATFWYHEFDRRPADRGHVDAVTDLDRLEAAWNRLIGHHPMLRATVGRDGRQRCAPPGPRYAFPRTDLRAATPDEVARTLDRLRHECSHQVRDPGRWPLFDIRAVLLPDGTVRLLLGFDILVLDFASWRLLMVRWGRLAGDPEAALEPEPFGFLDLVRHRETDPGEKERREEARRHWAERLDEIPGGPRLPLVREPGALTPPRFHRYGRKLAAPVWERLRARCADHGVSPTAALLAAFGLALHRWGARERFALNTTLFDRPEELPGAENVVGDFTTTALVALPGVDLLRWRGFAPFAREVNHAFWEAIDNRAYSAVELLRDLPASTPGAGALSHPVVFTSGLGVGDETAPARWLGEEAFGLSQTPQVLLDHLVWQEDGELRLAFDAVRDAFAPGWVDGLAGAVHRLLETLAGEPGAWDSAGLGWVPDFSRPEPLDVTAYPGAGPLLDDPRRVAARRYPQSPALLGTDGALSHADLDRRAREIAARLVDAGVTPGDLVLVGLPKGTAQVAAVLGVEGAGAGYVPVDPGWPAVRIAAVCARAGLRHALVLDGTPCAVPAGLRVTVLDEDGRPAGPSTEGVPDGVPVPCAPTDLAYTIFTSGSTGTPKGVAVEHGQARTTLDDITDRFGIGPDDRVLGLSALSFDLSVYDIFGVLGAGGALVLPDGTRQRDPQHWCELIGAFGVTVWNTAPALLELLVEYAEADPATAADDLRSLRLVMLSGDWIPVTLPDRLRRLVPGARVMSLGGATEAAIWSVTYPVGEIDPDWPSIPYGRPLRNQFFYILDEDGRPCPLGEPGGLYIAGAGVARGYLGDPEQTRQRFAVHPVLGERLYHTGDLGRWCADGTIQFLGRADRQVKINGHRIELGEVETVLNRLPDVRQAVVSAMPGPDDRPRLVAHVATAGRADERAVGEALRERLPEYLMPSRFVVMDRLPVTDNGKVDYRGLPNPFRRAAAGAGDRRPVPRAETPRPVARQAPPAPPGPLLGAVRDVLGAEADLSLGLVAAGATSLTVVRLANAIEDLTGDRPSFQELVAFDSIAALVAALGVPAQDRSPGSGTAGPDAPHDRQDAQEAQETQDPREPLRIAAPRGMDMALRVTVPHGTALADSLSETGRWLSQLHRTSRAHGYRVEETLLAGPRDLLEVRLIGDRPAAADRPPALPAVAPAAPDPSDGQDTGVRARPADPYDGGPFPLSEMQLAYLVGRADTWLGGSVAPHYYTEADVADLDLDRFARAVRCLVARHPMLRATITPDTRQMVRDEVPPIDIPVTDLRAAGPRQRDETLRRLRAERSHRVADPADWPLFRLWVTRLDETTSRLHLSLDLLFCDAQSAVVLAGELVTAYRDPALLPPAPTVTFAGWIAELRAAADGPRREKALRYWRRAAAEMADGPKLPLSLPGEVRFVRRRARLPRPVWDAVRRHARSAGVTPAALLLTAFSDVLRGAGGGDRFTLVLTTFDRPAAHRGVVGDYTSTVLLDVDPRGARSVAERAATVQNRLLTDLEHATGPGGVHGNEVLRELTARRGRQAVLPVVFSSGLGSTTRADGRDTDPSELLGALGETAHAISQTPHVVLDSQVFESDGELCLNWDAVESAFPAGYLDALFGGYVGLLHALAEAEAWHRDDPSGLAAGQVGRFAASAAGTDLRPGRSVAPGRGPAAPAVERRIATVIADLLGTDPEGIPVDRAFFELGATSLILVKAHLRLRAELDEGLTVVDLFAHPSVAALAAFVAQRTGTGTDTGPGTVPHGGRAPDPLLDSARRRGARRRERAAR
ncbi:amino acid adenylation domain-containing protein [Streptomyces sp. NPDC049881]|uniref:amino acid adenylation domain-containing protein n=1 Tax=Streptomyces sp. NPDC049881 TaxID=3155778 RepID=UPI00341414A1